MLSNSDKGLYVFILFFQRLKKNKLDAQFGKFFEVFKKLHINILFVDSFTQMSSYAKFMKDILSNKRKLEEHEAAMLIEECSGFCKTSPCTCLHSREYSHLSKHQRLSLNDSCISSSYVKHGRTKATDIVIILSIQSIYG